MKKAICRNMEIVNGPASWQQTVRLRDESIHGMYAAISNLFPIPAAISDELLLTRLAEIVQREDALRIVGGTIVGSAIVSYASTVDVRVEHLRAGCVTDMMALAAKTITRTFKRDGAPLWEFSIFRFPDEHGEPTRTACIVLDHFVTDGRSMHLIERELTRDIRSPWPRSRGQYRDWVRDQRTKFPMSGTHSPTLASEFWRRHLDGTSADRPTALPFSAPPPSVGRGELTAINMPIPMSVGALRTMAARLNLTPFVLVLASIAATTAAVSGADDITLRAIVSGRPAGHLNTLGWFADSVPVRLAHPRLHDPGSALATACRAWVDILDYQTTPLDYIRQACPPVPRLEIPPERRRMQVVVNLVPHDIGGMFSEDVPERIRPGDIDGLHLVVLPDPRQRLRLGAVFNAEVFPTKPTRAFLRRVIDDLSGFINFRVERR